MDNDNECDKIKIVIKDTEKSGDNNRRLLMKIISEIEKHFIAIGKNKPSYNQWVKTKFGVDYASKKSRGFFQHSADSEIMKIFSDYRNLEKDKQKFANE